jgi:hypothetical protein
MSSNSSTASDSSNVAAPANSSPDQLQATSTATALIDNSLSALWRLMLEQMPKHAATMGELGCISALVHGWRSSASGWQRSAPLLLEWKHRPSETRESTLECCCC